MAKFNILIQNEAGVRIGETTVEVQQNEEVTIKSVAFIGMQVKRIVDDFYLDEAYRACSRKIEPNGVAPKVMSIVPNKEQSS